MHKNTITILMAAALLLGSTGCGKTEDVNGSLAGSVEIKTVSETLLSDIAFTDDLALIDDDTVTVLYGIDNAAEQYVYIGSGATPEEIALFSFATEAEAEAGFALAEMRIADQKEAFSDYNSWEMPKLDEAVVKQYGTTVALCISPDADAAEALLDENLG